MIHQYAKTRKGETGLDGSEEVNSGQFTEKKASSVPGGILAMSEGEFIEEKIVLPALTSLH